MTDSAIAERQDFLNPPQPFPRFRAGVYLGMLLGAVAASALKVYMANHADRKERERLGAEVSKCPGDTVLLESGLRICKAGMFRVVPRRAA